MICKKKSNPLHQVYIFSIYDGFVLYHDIENNTQECIHIDLFFNKYYYEMQDCLKVAEKLLGNCKELLPL